MKEEYSNIDRLVEAYLEGRLKEHEYALLSDLIKSSHANKAYFDNYISQWKSSDNEELNRSWRNLNSKISRLSVLESNYHKKQMFSSVFLRVAAILIIGLFLGGLVGSLYFTGRFSNRNALVFVAPKGDKSTITLSDSSKIWLNGDSRVEVDRNYGITNRRIKMEGEAYFEVAKNKFLPFNVMARDINVRVVGTKFNISAYKSDNYIETTVKEGIVKVMPKSSEEFEAISLTANQTAVFDVTNHKLQVNKTDVDTKIAWKDEMLIIDNEHYSRAFKKLGNWFGVNFNVNGQLNYDPKYTMTIKTESLSEVMELLQFITPMDYKVDKDQVYVKFKRPN